MTQTSLGLISCNRCNYPILTYDKNYLELKEHAEGFLQFDGEGNLMAVNFDGYNISPRKDDE